MKERRTFYYRTQANTEYKGNIWQLFLITPSVDKTHLLLLTLSSLAYSINLNFQSQILFSI